METDPHKSKQEDLLDELHHLGPRVINSSLIHIETRRCRNHNVALRGFIMEDIDDYCRMLT